MLSEITLRRGEGSEFFEFDGEVEKPTSGYRWCRFDFALFISSGFISTLLEVFTPTSLESTMYWSFGTYTQPRN